MQNYLRLAQTGTLYAFCLISACTPASEPVQTKDWEVFPNKNTVEECIALQKNADDSATLKKLITRLQKDRFKVEKRSTSTALSVMDCKNNKQIIFEGVVSTYFAKRTIPEKGSQFYPDLWFHVLPFKDTQSAADGLIKLSSALDNDMMCDGKAPVIAVQNQHEVYYFATRAEAFRTYTNRYSDFVKQK